MNNEIAEMCMKHGTIVFNSIDTNRSIEQLVNKYGTNVYHS